jgi:hypothetical protein
MILRVVGETSLSRLSVRTMSLSSKSSAERVGAQESTPVTVHLV